jgi:hypothetical protein
MLINLIIKIYINFLMKKFKKNRMRANQHIFIIDKIIFTQKKELGKLNSIFS